VFIFRLMHPPLLVSWSDIKVRRSKGWFFGYVILTMGHEGPLRIQEKLAAKLRESAGNYWPGSQARAVRGKKASLESRRLRPMEYVEEHSHAEATKRINE
jgi:hypothetical protein